MKRRLTIAPEPGLLAPLRHRVEQMENEVARTEEEYGTGEEIPRIFRTELRRCTARLHTAETSAALSVLLFSK